MDALVGGTTHQLALRRGRTTPDIVALSMLENRDHSVTEQESRCAAASTLNLMQGVAYRYNKAVWAVPPHSTVAKPGSGRVVALAWWAAPASKWPLQMGIEQCRPASAPAAAFVASTSSPATGRTAGRRLLSPGHCSTQTMGAGVDVTTAICVRHTAQPPHRVVLGPDHEHAAVRHGERDMSRAKQNYTSEAFAFRDVCKINRITGVFPTNTKKS